MKLPYKTLCTIADCFCIGELCNEVTLQDVVVLLQIIFALVYYAMKLPLQDVVYYMQIVKMQLVIIQ